MEKMQNDLTSEQLDERVAIIKRFKTLLEMKRAEFQEYLVVLEKQQNGIVNENDEAIANHAELGAKIVSNLSNLNKVIKPIETMYLENDVYSAEIPKLKLDLDDLQKEVLKQNAKNQELLRKHLFEIKKRLAKVNNPKINPYASHLSIYAQKRQTATVLDVEG